MTRRSKAAGGAPAVDPGAGDGSPADRQFVTALARGLDILSCFDATGTGLGGTEIAGLLGLPQPTVWRLCNTMTKLGFLSVTDDDRLRPALPTLRLGYAVLSPLTVGELAQPHLQDLAMRVSGAAGLAVRDGPDMRFVERCVSENQLVMNLRVGSRVPVATSALGWAYLSGLDPDEREAVLEDVKPERKLWRTVEPAFRRAMAEAAADGFVVNAGAFHPGYNTAAVPLAGPDDRPAYAMNCGASASILSTAALRTTVGPRLRDLARLLHSVE